MGTSFSPERPLAAGNHDSIWFEVPDQPGSSSHSLWLSARLLRLEKESVNGSAKISSTQNFAFAVNARGYKQRPAGPRRNGLVEIDHLASLPEKRHKFAFSL